MDTNSNIVRGIIRRLCYDVIRYEVITSFEENDGPLPEEICNFIVSSISTINEAIKYMMIEFEEIHDMTVLHHVEPEWVYVILTNGIL